MTTSESRDDTVYDHDEADMTMISCVIDAAKCAKDVIRVLSDDTDVFVHLIYWVYREEMTSKAHMERCDGTVLDINATCADLGPKCLQLLGMHAISGCYTTSYPYAKGKYSVSKRRCWMGTSLVWMMYWTRWARRSRSTENSNNVFPGSLRSSTGDILRICPFHIVHTQKEMS